MQATSAGAGKRSAGRSRYSVRVHRFGAVPGALGTLRTEELRAWVDELTSTAMVVGGAGDWQRLREPAPPLRADEPPSVRAHILVWFFSWGWIVATILVGGGGAAVFYAPQIQQWYDKQRRQARQQQQQQRQQQEQQQQRDQTNQTQQQQPQQQPHASQRTPPQDAEGDESDAGPSPASRTPSSGSASTRRYAESSPGSASAAASAEGLSALSADTLSAVLGRGSYTLIFVTNAGVASRATMLATAAHFAEQSAAGVSDFRGWAIVTLDFAAESSRESKPPLLRALLARLRASPVGVLRKGQTLACFSGQPSVRLVGEWIAKLRMGEVEWARLSDDGPLSPAMDEEPG